SRRRDEAEARDGEAHPRGGSEGDDAVAQAKERRAKQVAENDDPAGDGDEPAARGGELPPETLVASPAGDEGGVGDDEQAGGAMGHHRERKALELTAAGPGAQSFLERR